MTTSATAPERDPVCGMNVDPARAKYVHEQGGKKYYFCCAACVEKFKANPSRYLNRSASSELVRLGAPGPASSGRPESVQLTQLQPVPNGPGDSAAAPIYVCPMCAE